MDRCCYCIALAKNFWTIFWQCSSVADLDLGYFSAIKETKWGWWHEQKQLEMAGQRLQTWLWVSYFCSFLLRWATSWLFLATEGFSSSRSLLSFVKGSGMNVLMAHEVVNGYMCGLDWGLQLCCLVGITTLIRTSLFFFRLGWASIAVVLRWMVSKTLQSTLMQS